VWLIERSPFWGLNAQSNTGMCSSFRPGAPSIVPCCSMYAVIPEPTVSVYPRRRSAAGTVPLTSFSIPPPTRRLYFTSAMSGSTPVVSQSIMKLIVPVGASTEACALR
jgi:hypothetical protein